MSNTAFLRVSPNVARNPVARAVERKRMAGWLTDMQIIIHQLQDGEECRSVIVASVETLATAMKSVEGWSDPEAVGETITDAIVSCEHIANRDFSWDTKATKILCDGLDFAIQILGAVSAQEKNKAWKWAQGLKTRGVV